MFDASFHKSKQQQQQKKLLHIAVTQNLSSIMAGPPSLWKDKMQQFSLFLIFNTVPLWLIICPLLFKISRVIFSQFKSVVITHWLQMECIEIRLENVGVNHCFSKWDLWSITRGVTDFFFFLLQKIIIHHYYILIGFFNNSKTSEPINNSTWTEYLLSVKKGSRAPINTQNITVRIFK